MSEAPAPRTPASVQNDFNQLAFKAGLLQYEIKERTSNLEMLQTEMRNLSVEFLKVKAAADTVAAEAAAKAAETTKQPDAGLGSTDAETPKKRGRGPNKAKATEGTVQ